MNGAAEMTREVHPETEEEDAENVRIQGAGHPTMYINPMLVRAVIDWEQATATSPAYTVIEFDKEHRINLPLPVEQVRQALDRAMNED